MKKKWQSLKRKQRSWYQSASQVDPCIWEEAVRKDTY